VLVFDEHHQHDAHQMLLQHLDRQKRHIQS
jgi:hypothetical protein